jgi:DUF1009 family protein
MSDCPQHAPIGLLAGWGRFPVLVAEALAARGLRTSCLGIRGHADPELRARCEHFAWVGLGRLGWAARWFARHGVRQVVLAGKVHKVRLFRPRFWLHHVPDWRTLRLFFGHFVLGRRDRRDDTLLAAVCDELAVDGLQVVPATDLVPELLVPYGRLTRRGPTRQELQDIAYGWRLAKELGRFDVGQCACVKGRVAVALEAIEGTDACILRAGELCRTGFTVVKVAKPRQDMRFDVPTIGLGTLENMIRAKARCLAVEAEKTIFVDRAACLDLANRHGLAIVALRAADGVANLEQTSPETPCESRER